MNDSTFSSRSAIADAAHWHAVQRMQPLDAKQEQQLLDWLTASPQHLREYLAMQRVAGDLGEALRGMDLDVDALLASDDTADGAASGNVIALPLPRRAPATATVAVGVAAAPARGARTGAAPRWRLAAAAAVCAVCAVAVLVGWAWPRSQTYTTALGEQRSVQLADGSVVRLNAQTRVQATLIPWSRTLQLLQGQASFVVAADRRPLQVQAGGLRVEDIGTTFDITLHPDQARIEVSAGRVQVWRQDQPQQPMLADLGAGQSARIDTTDGRVELGNEDVAAMHAWWQRRIVFRDEPLANVAEDFNRLNRTRLLIDDADAGAMRLTGNLRGDDVAALRAFLDTQPTLQVHTGADGIHVRSRIPTQARLQ